MGAAFKRGLIYLCYCWPDGLLLAHAKPRLRNKIHVMPLIRASQNDLMLAQGFLSFYLALIYSVMWVSFLVLMCS